ncbi:hypothetical protein Tco_0988380 [Tanacetum coccineum]|uniref:Reverse transcriptase domain-containing protein n=1 Tax=Tanacetum coccineum TaxID=301880 RepID=A0ABQ5EQS9_9ASTR
MQELSEQLREFQDKGVQARERTRRKATWFRSTDGKKKIRECVLYGSDLGSIGRKCNGRGPCIKEVKTAMSKDFWLAATTRDTEVENEIESQWILSLDSKIEMDGLPCGFGRRYRNYHLSIWCAPFEALYGRKCRSHVLWVEIGESSLTGLELVQETTDMVVLRFPEELSCVHNTFHVSNVKKNVLVDASLHVPLDEIKVDKTLRFVEEPVENSDREVKRLKCSRIVVVKVHLGSKRGRQVVRIKSLDEIAKGWDTVKP